MSNNNTYKFENGNEFVGKFDVRLKEGTMTYQNGDKYVGAFDDQNKRHGNGILMCVDGLQYEGLFTKNHYNGKGKIVLKNGFIILFYNSLDVQKNISLEIRENNTILRFIVNNECTREYDLPIRFESFGDLVKYFSSDVVLDTKNLTGPEIETITCPISMTIMKNPIVTQCGHEFCEITILQCNNTCPICRETLTFLLPAFATIELMKKIIFSVNGKTISYEQYTIHEKLLNIFEKYGLKIEKKVKSVDLIEKTKTKAGQSKKSKNYYSDSEDEVPKAGQSKKSKNYYSDSEDEVPKAGQSKKSKNHYSDSEDEVPKAGQSKKSKKHYSDSEDEVPKAGQSKKSKNHYSDSEDEKPVKKYESSDSDSQ